MKKGIKVNIRKFKPEDEGQIVRYIKRAFCGKKFLFIALTKAPDKKRQREWIESIKKKKKYCFVAEIDGKVIACLNFDLDKGRLRHRAAMGWSVDPEYWKKGVGSALLKKAVEKAKKIGLKRLECEIAKPNIASRKLVEKLKFKREGIKKKGMLLDNKKYVDTFIYGRII